MNVGANPFRISARNVASAGFTSDRKGKGNVMTQDNPTPSRDPYETAPATPPPPSPYPAASSSAPPPPPVAAHVAYATPDGGVVENDKEARTWGMVAHLSGLVGLLGVPPVAGPLVVWLVKKKDFPFVDDQGKEAINFHITVLIALAACVPAILCVGLGVVAMIGVGIAATVFTIIGAMKANQGIAYRYPFTLRLVK